MDNARFVNAGITTDKPGVHVFKVWMIDPGPVLEKIVIDTGGVKESYLGSPESFLVR